MQIITKRTASMLLLVAVTMLQAGCASSGRPKSFVTTPNESGIWKSIEVREGATRTVLWSTVVDALSSKFDLEVLDKESGYVRTGWNSTVVRTGGGGGPRMGGRGGDASESRYRARIITKFNADFSILQIKSEANWLDDGSWVVGYDTLVLEDIYGDLQGRIGRVRR